jgi:hypothetical protein
MPRRNTGELHTRAAWFRLILECKEVKDRKRMRLTEAFVVRYGGTEEVIPAGTEVVFFCLYKGDKGTTKLFRTEGVFYLEGGRTLSIMGYYGRSVPKGQERERRRKTVEVKEPSGLSTFDAMRPSRSLVLAGL